MKLCRTVISVNKTTTYTFTMWVARPCRLKCEIRFK